MESPQDLVTGGRVHHNVAPMFPVENKMPRFGQVYILDTETAVQARRGIQQNDVINPVLLRELSIWFAENNPFAGSYKMMKTVYDEERELAITEGRVERTVRLLFDANCKRMGHQYALPQANEVAAVFVGEDNIPPEQSLIVHAHGAGLISVGVADPMCDPLTYPLYFPHGELGWEKSNRSIQFEEPIPGRALLAIDQPPATPSPVAGAAAAEDDREQSAQHDSDQAEAEDAAEIEIVADTRQAREPSNGKCMRAHFLNVIFVREAWSPVHFAEKLLQQYIVDAFCRIESYRLNYFRKQQKSTFSAPFQLLSDALHVRDVHLQGPLEVGKRIVLPFSVVGSPRWIQQQYMDAMNIVACFGKPDIFLTFTCNPNWPEIRENLGAPFLRPADRPDLIARVFKIKLYQLFKDLKAGRPFGKVTSFVAKVEFQKRGLPHCHIQLTLQDCAKPRTPVMIDRIVCAEIPENSLILKEKVLSCMVHHPCGPFNPNAPCMQDGICTKDYPKQLCDATWTKTNGKIGYRRCDRPPVIVGGLEITNKWIVPYNPWLLDRYNAHINVEICSSVLSVKYLYKYVYKGPDRAILKVVGAQELPDRSSEPRLTVAPVTAAPNRGAAAADPQYFLRMLMLILETKSKLTSMRAMLDLLKHVGACLNFRCSSSRTPLFVWPCICKGSKQFYSHKEMRGNVSKHHVIQRYWLGFH